MDSRIRQFIFFSLAIIGVFATWHFNIRHINAKGGFTVSAYLADVYANDASSSIGNDILVVVAAFFFWSHHEAKRLNMKFWPVYVVLTFLVAMAFTFPLFMYMRERKLADLSAEK